MSSTNHASLRHVSQVDSSSNANYTNPFSDCNSKSWSVRCSPLQPQRRRLGLTERDEGVRADLGRHARRPTELRQRPLREALRTVLHAGRQRVGPLLRLRLRVLRRVRSRVLCVGLRLRLLTLVWSQVLGAGLCLRIRVFLAARICPNMQNAQ